MKVIAMILAVGVAATACTATTEPDPSPSPTESSASPTPTPSPTPTRTPPPRASAMVYATSSGTGAFGGGANDLWYYDVAADSVSRLTRDGDDTIEAEPRFVREDLIVYREAGGERTRVFTMDPTERPAAPTVLFSSRNSVVSIDPEPGGDRYAFMRLVGEQRAPRIVLYDDGEFTTLRTITPGGAYGRGGRDDDEIIVRWSPDGSKLLVVYTPLDLDEETLWVIDAETGADVIEPRFGTFGRWAPDSRTVYWREFNDPDAWFALDLLTETDAPLDLGDGLRPDVSPDGARIAYDTGGEEPSVRVFTIASGNSKVIGSGLADVRWFTPSRLIAGGTSACSADPDCFEGVGPPWTPDGTTRILRRQGGTTTPASAQTTFDGAVFFG